MTRIAIRDPMPADELRWRELWEEYYRFYETAVPEEVIEQALTIVPVVEELLFKSRFLYLQSVVNAFGRIRVSVGLWLQ